MDKAREVLVQLILWPLVVIGIAFAAKITWILLRFGWGVI